MIEITESQFDEAWKKYSFGNVMTASNMEEFKKGLGFLMSKDKRDMSIEEEFEKEYNTHLEELRSRGFTDNFLEMEKSGKWLPRTWFLRGYKCSQKELQEKLDAAIEVIRFYGNHSTWKTSEFSEDYKIEYKCRISSEEDGENTSESFIRGGKRARDFLKARGE